MAITTEPLFVTFEAPAFIYVEKRGPAIQSAPLAWEAFTPRVNSILGSLPLGVAAGLSRTDLTQEGDDAFIYQAGMILSAVPEAIPEGLQMRPLTYGAYASFMLTGSYTQLPQAYPTAFTLLEQQRIRMREEFCIERYVTDPAVTPEAELQTEILIPIQ